MPKARRSVRGLSLFCVFSSAGLSGSTPPLTLSMKSQQAEQIYIQVQRNSRQRQSDPHACLRVGGCVSAPPLLKEFR